MCVLLIIIQLINYMLHHAIF